MKLELELVELKNGNTFIGIKIENCVNMVNGIKILQPLLQHLLDLEPTTSFCYQSSWYLYLIEKLRDVLDAIQVLWVCTCKYENHLYLTQVLDPNPGI